MSLSELSHRKRGFFSLCYFQLLMLGMLLSIDPELDRAYSLYHAYASFNSHDFNGNLIAVENKLNHFINECRLSGINQFLSLADTLEYWKKEIVNSFAIVDRHRISNGPIEGRNSLIKKILRLANGYDNFYRFRNRIIYSLNRFAAHSFPHSKRE